MFHKLPWLCKNSSQKRQSSRGDNSRLTEYICMKNMSSTSTNQDGCMCEFSRWSVHKCGRSLLHKNGILHNTHTVKCLSYSRGDNSRQTWGIHIKNMSSISAYKHEYMCEVWSWSNNKCRRRKCLKIFSFGCHGNQNFACNGILWIAWKEDLVRNIHGKFHHIQVSGYAVIMEIVLSQFCVSDKPISPQGWYVT